MTTPKEPKETAKEIYVNACLLYKRKVYKPQINIRKSKEECILEAIEAAIRSERQGAQGKEEQRIMELAAISCASIWNTEESKKERIGRDNPYWTVAYQDVCVAIDREIKLRAENQRLRAALKEVDAAIMSGQLEDTLWIPSDLALNQTAHECIQSALTPQPDKEGK